MTISTYKSAELFIDGVSVGEVLDVTVDVKPWAPKLVQDRSCDTCGAKWLVWGDGSTKVESCFEHAHANKRGVGPHHCLCGHLEVDHGLLGAGHLACAFCPTVGDTCSRFTRCPKVDE